MPEPFGAGLAAGVVIMGVGPCAALFPLGLELDCDVAYGPQLLEVSTSSRPDAFLMSSRP